MTAPQTKCAISVPTALIAVAFTIATAACAGGAAEPASPTEELRFTTAPAMESDPTSTPTLVTEVPPTDTPVPPTPTETPTPQPATHPPATTAPDLDVAPSVGAAAPPLVLPDLNGEEVNLTNLRGKPVLLNFWTTW